MVRAFENLQGFVCFNQSILQMDVQKKKKMGWERPKETVGSEIQGGNEDGANLNSLGPHNGLHEVPVEVDEEVGGLDVQVEHPLVVDVLQALGNLPGGPAVAWGSVIDFIKRLGKEWRGGGEAESRLK